MVADLTHFQPQYHGNVRGDQLGLVSLANLVVFANWFVIWVAGFFFSPFAVQLNGCVWAECGQESECVTESFHLFPRSFSTGVYHLVLFITFHLNQEATVGQMEL